MNGRAQGALVTMEQFAAFLRADDGYFERKNWPEGLFRGARGGDEVLERLGFRWGARTQPVLGVTWFEASAFCRWNERGRLPYAAECAAGSVGPAAVPEWCGDWCNRLAPAGGPTVPPDDRALRRVHAHATPCVAPDYLEGRIGFRVVWGDVSVPRGR